MSQIPTPFRLLTLGRTTLPTHQPAEFNTHIASFRDPDGTVLEGMPASSKPEAVLNLFAADAGRPLVLPYANHFLPLCDATVQLCEAFSWLLYYEFRFEDLLMDHAAQGHPLPEEETFRAVRELLAAVQSTVEEANRLPVLLKDIHPDPRAGATRDHPLTFYAEFELAPNATRYCKMVTDSLDIPGAIAEAGLNFAVHGALVDPRWPAEQAQFLMERRQGLLRHYVRWRHRLKATAPSEEEHAEWIDDMQGLAAAHCAKRFGFEVPKEASGRARLLAAIQEATTLH
jgi:hypothetical protein